MPKEHSLQTLLISLAKILSKNYPSSDEALTIASWIVEFSTGLSRAQQLAHRTIHLSTDQESKLFNIIDLHCNQSKPLQYIIGNIPFLDLTLKLEPPILIPRPETEYLCSLIIDTLKDSQPLTILDIGTGTGCIALALAKKFPLSHVYAVDINLQACQLAQINAQQNSIKNVTVIKSDLFNNIPRELKFDLIVSNPPYISNVEWDSLQPSVKLWEDKDALIADNNGLHLLNAIISEAPLWLNKKNGNYTFPQLILEFGQNQDTDIIKLLEKHLYKNSTIYHDQFGVKRFSSAQI